MTTSGPILASWDGEHFIPARRHAKELAASMVVGEWYYLDVAEKRSMAEHRFYFASLKDIWSSLPEVIGERFPTVASFRKAGLIACGFCHKAEIVCANNQQALKLAATLARMDDYAVAEVRDRVAAIWTADSQSLKAMGNDRFKASKQAVLEWAAAQIGVNPNVLDRDPDAERPQPPIEGERA
jgi:hypothetical protein